MTIKEYIDNPKNREVMIEIDSHKIGNPYTYTEYEGKVKDIPAQYWLCECDKAWSVRSQRWTLDIGYQDSQGQGK